MTKDKDWFRQGANLAQQLSDLDNIFQHLAGTDPETSEAIAFFLTMGELGYIDLKDEGIKLLLALLNGKRKALFATSPTTNEISKMGLMMPKSDAVYIDE